MDDTDGYFTVRAPEISVIDENTGHLDFYSVMPEDGPGPKIYPPIWGDPGPILAPKPGTGGPGIGTPTIPTPGVPAPGGDISLDQIVNFGERIWKLVEANRPIVSAETKTADALPQGLQSWDELSDWKTPVSKLFRVHYKNMYGGTVVDFTVRLIYTYGGNYKGTGRYLTNVTIAPADLVVGWGYKFSSEVRVPKVLNIGSKDAPMAGMEILTSWKIDTVLKSQTQSVSFFVQGDGEFVDLSKGRSR